MVVILDFIKCQCNWFFSWDHLISVKWLMLTPTFTLLDIQISMYKLAMNWAPPVPDTIVGVAAGQVIQESGQLASIHSCLSQQPISISAGTSLFYT
jgi:acyl carrier protein phosphodiesterase